MPLNEPPHENFLRTPLKRVFELREPMQRLLLEKNSNFADKFSDDKWSSQTCLLL